MDSVTVPPEPWQQRLKDAFGAGYYRESADVDQQSSWPWQNKTCSSCPFFEQSNISTTNRCRVHNQTRRPTDHTCIYFDESNHQTGLDIVNERHRKCGLPPFTLPNPEKESAE